MEKKICSLTFMQKFAVSALLVISFCMFFQTEYYHNTMKEDFSISYLQAGDYRLRVRYENSPEGNQLAVSSDSLIDSYNNIGVEYARVAMAPGNGEVEFDISLEEPAWDVTIHTNHEDPAAEHYIIQEVEIEGQQLLCNDNYFLCGLFAALAVMVWLACSGRIRVKSYMPLIAAAMGLLVSLPYMNNILMDGHDIEFHLARIEGIYQGIRMGQFPVRINPVQLEGYGNITGIMYPQLFLYAPALLRCLGVSVMLAYKLLVVSINIMTAVFMYFAVKNICQSEKTAALAAFLYTFSAYRLMNVYTRSSLGEMLAMVFFPLVVWGMYEILWGDRKKWYILMLGMSGILQSHVLSVEICVLFLLIELVIFFFTREKNQLAGRLLSGCFAAAGTVLLNVWYLVPFLYYSREEFQALSMENVISTSAVYFSQMFSAFSHATGVSKAIGTTQYEMPLSIGAILLAGSILFVVQQFGRKETAREDRLGRHCLVAGAIAVLMVSWIFPWDMIESVDFLDMLFSPLQFVWRFLGVASLMLSIVSAIAFERAAGNAKREWVYAAVCVTVLLSTSFYFSKSTNEMEYYSDKMALNGLDVTDSLYLYTDASFHYFHRNQAAIRCTGDSEVIYSDYVKEGTTQSVNVSVMKYKEGDSLIFPVYYYPGYEVRVNGEKVSIMRLDTMVALALPEEDSYIEISFTGHWIFKVSDAVSIAAIAVFGGWYIVKRRKKSTSSDIDSSMLPVSD